MQLPIMKRLTVEHLSLYTQSIYHTIHPGINMVIGGNGLGKTTLVNTILFALVGNVPCEVLNPRTGMSEPIFLIPSDYFSGRLKPQDQKQARVTLEFEVDNKEVAVTRALFHPRIVRIELRDRDSGESRVEEGGSDELEAMYQQMMKKMLGIEQFEHFIFLVANLLVFGEERRTLVWDSAVQNRVIRLLFLEKEFDERFDELVESIKFVPPIVQS